MDLNIFLFFYFFIFKILTTKTKVKIMKLNVSERLMLLQILPKEGNFATLKIIRQLQDSIGFNESEFKEFNIKHDKNNITWDSTNSII